MFLDDKLLTIDDDSGSFQFVICSPGFECEAVHSCSVLMLLDGVGIWIVGSLGILCLLDEAMNGRGEM